MQAAFSIELVSMSPSIDILYSTSQDNLDPARIESLYPCEMKELSVIASYVRAARQAASLTQDQLAEKLGMTKGNISGWENDKHSPSPHQLATLSRISGLGLPPELSPVNVRAYLGNRQVPEGAHHLKPSHEVPVVGTTQGGPPDRLWQELNYPVGYSDQFLEAATPDPHAYALRVVGNSMAPRMMEGEWIMVEPSAEAQAGCDVVIRTIDGRVMVKRLLSRHNDTIILESVNEAFSRVTLMAHEVEFIHRIGGMFPSWAIKQRVGEAIGREEYKGPLQRVIEKPVASERRRYVLPPPMETEDRDYPYPQLDEKRKEQKR